MLLTFATNAFVLLIVFAQGNAHLFSSLLLAVAFLCSSACFAHAVFNRSLSIASFSLLLYMTYGYLLAGLYQVRMDQFYWLNNSVRRDLITDACFITMIGTVALTFGYFLRVATLPRVPTQPPPAMPLRQRATAGATLAVNFISAGYLALLIARYGPLAFLGTRFSTNEFLAISGVDSTSLGLTITLGRGMALGAFLITGFVYFHLEIRSWTMRLALLVAAATMGIGCFPPAIPRFWLIAMLIIIAATVAHGWLKSWKRMLYTSAPLLMFLIFPFLQSYNRRQATLNLAYEIPSPLEAMVHGDYDGVQSVINVVDLVQREGLALGGRLLSSLLFFVPRTIWSGKHEPTGSDAAQVAGYSFFNISTPLPGEFYADYGYIGAIAGMFLVGWLVRSLDDAIDRGGRSEVMMAGLLLAAFFPILARGPLLGVISAPASVLFLILLWGALRRIGGRRERRLAPPVERMTRMPESR